MPRWENCVTLNLILQYNTVRRSGGRGPGTTCADMVKSSCAPCWHSASRKHWNCPLSLRRQICWAVVDIVCLTCHTDVKATRLRLPGRAVKPKRQRLQCYPLSAAVSRPSDSLTALTPPPSWMNYWAECFSQWASLCVPVSLAEAVSCIWWWGKIFFCGIQVHRKETQHPVFHLLWFCDPYCKIVVSH